MERCEHGVFLTRDGLSTYCSVCNPQNQDSEDVKYFQMYGTLVAEEKVLLRVLFEGEEVSRPSAYLLKQLRRIARRENLVTKWGEACLADDGSVLIKLPDNPYDVLLVAKKIEGIWEFMNDTEYVYEHVLGNANVDGSDDDMDIDTEDDDA